MNLLFWDKFHGLPWSMQFNGSTAVKIDLLKET
jgi:hypothetical protein